MDRPRILVVDDESTVRHVIRQVLQRRDCDVREAGSAEEALEILEQWVPDVALLDVAMPGKNGLQLLETIRDRSLDVEVLIMTSYSSVETVTRAMRGGAHDFLPKPFDLSTVWTAIERALQKRELSAARNQVADRLGSNERADGDR